MDPVLEYKIRAAFSNGYALLPWAPDPTFIKSVQPKTPPPRDAVLAPVVVDAKTPEGVRSFLSYVDTLTRNSNTEIAKAEAHRLEPYFAAMSEYVAESLQKPPPHWWSKPFSSSSVTAISTAWKSPSEAPFTPESLSNLFNALAAATHATLISDVVIVPSDIKDGPAADLFRGHWEFSAPYEYLGHTFEFGFLQAYEGGIARGAKSSTTFPIFTLDHRMIDAIPPEEAEPLLRGLQGVLGVVNHDMLHHFTSAVIRSNTVHNDLEDDAHNPLRTWNNALHLTGIDNAYEKWALRSQENILSKPAAKPLVENARVALDDYMDGLGRIANALYNPADQHTGAADGAKRKAHEVIDYFGMVMAHSLLRGFPLHHDLVQHCLDRLQMIDPIPESAAEDCAGSRLFKGLKVGDALPDGTIVTSLPPDDLQSIRKNLRGIELDVINSYSKLGVEILPKDDKDVSYKHLKMLQLINLDGAYARDPDPEPGVLKEFRENIADYTLTALQAAAKLSTPAPQKISPATPKP